MANISAQALALSMAGHDRGKLYVVLREENGVCTLVNGSTKPLDKPKQKKSMHIQRIIHLKPEIRAKMDKICGDQDVIDILETYKNL